MRGNSIGMRLPGTRDSVLATHATFAFLAVLLDSITDEAKALYQRFDCRELSGYSYRLYLSAAELAALMEGE